MQIHVVKAGETLSAIARLYNADSVLIARYNGLRAPYPLAVGQSLIIPDPEVTTIAQKGDTLYAIAQRFKVSVLQLLRLNPQLDGTSALNEGDTLVISLKNQGYRPVELLGYAYPNADPALLRSVLPFATYLAPFTHGIAADGTLVAPMDDTLLRLARQYNAVPLLHLSTLTEEGRFSTGRAQTVLDAPALQDALIESVLRRMESEGYRGLDVDFEFLGAANAAAYAAFLSKLRDAVNAHGWELFAALPPKTSRTQSGILYEGHDYAAIAKNADAVLLMTYEWGYTYGPPMAVAPIGSVRRVLDFAKTELPMQKVFLGFPNYGYDWTLPYEAGSTKAQSISNEYAPLLAAKMRAEIRYDETAQAPYFYYTASDGAVHEVWFEDARSTQAKLALVPEYDLRGLGVWHLGRPFTTAYLQMVQQFDLVKAKQA
ncbi:MAG: LysM peptidoglycan-binding domain-containing protein [Oscillospiraceae bacterium]|nr:LysM peptidoglycan-binding domain-containing protein [Oscillospiraceae bacterium]